MRAIQPGDVVKLTGTFLKNTGQRKGSEGAKKWTVRACDCPLCSRGEFVSTDEKLSSGWFTAEELAADPSLLWRHINKGNVYVVGTLDSRNTPL
jgi:hypothetical protein